MTSLMSIFDPTMSIMNHLGWVVAVVMILPFKLFYWKSFSSLLLTLKLLLVELLKLFKTQKVVFLALFLFILNMNLAGLLPLVFSPTSHLSLNIMLSLTLWLGGMIWYLYNNLKQFLAHLTPIGCPMLLAPALVLIELVSNLIRPLTLSLRLMANIMAGHMILTLISKGVASMLIAKGPMFLVLTGFMMFEFGVALIQAYVFSSLMALYWEESESSH